MAKSPFYCNRSEAFEAHDDIPLSPKDAPTIGEVVYRRYSRRDVIRGSLGVAAAAALFGSGALGADTAAAKQAPESRFDFDEVAAGIDETHHVADGYEAQILLRWGDPLFPDSPPFDPNNQSPAAQLKQFGYNNDYIGFIPLNEDGSQALLCVNHEYTNEEVMFPGLGRQDKEACFSGMTKELVDIEMAAHGVSIVEIAKQDDLWKVRLDSPYNRRISSLTKMSVDGPAAGHARLHTKDDPDGQTITGTLNNCAGGVTPWGTYLASEENFHGYFWTEDHDGACTPAEGLGGDQAESYARYGVPALWYAWGRYYDRFNVDREPNEANRFGWVCEIDPFDPASTPVKHTALGRYRHEGAECLLNKDGRAVVYCGDDGKFDYVYRFVSKGTYDPDDRAANMWLLSEGTLSAARFNDDGSVDWLPLVFGENGLTPENGFASQADVVINARLAADKLGATRMDRPEDIQPNLENGRVYLMLTNNTKREADDTDTANPRGDNAFGHIIEMTPPDGDHAAAHYAWDMLVQCGDPSVAGIGAVWNPDTSESGWFACPDNAAVDSEGRLWVATDQGEYWDRTGKADGLYAMETEGDGRSTAKLFFRCPVGAEMCGPCFAPDQETAFVAVQHPGTDGTDKYPGFERASTFEDPATRWPDFDPAMPPRPSVVAITKKGGGKIA
ncbi:PhoX family phosphatase [Methyloligella sp. 2.7D]|uniref:PhoX family protein n=1 Tax=unclassified Methyloligella TaxID=2625955 RepID=UPI00157CC0A4|nr:PhoX family phosphatase [Methyloligella sp. GL2]QKP77793.1 PhoX family phosphatase [Methyloligella sp. GL2]